MATRIEPLAGQRQKRESIRAVEACNDWLRLGPGRTLRGLLDSYSKIEKNEAPTTSRATLMAWSSRYLWAKRAEEYDTRLEAEKNERARQIMESGLALIYERVGKLKTLADFLEGQMYEQGEDDVFHNVWLPDVKQIGSGEYAERVDIERFNAAIIAEFRATLDDLAKETGGRKQAMDVTSGGYSLLDVEKWKIERQKRLEEAAQVGEAEDGAGECGTQDA